MDTDPNPFRDSPDRNRGSGEAAEYGTYDKADDVDDEDDVASADINNLNLDADVDIEDDDVPGMAHSSDLDEDGFSG